MIKSNKQKIEFKYTPVINYESESVDICRFCCNALRKNDFYYNSTVKNLELLENILFNYSILKVLSWDKLLKTDHSEEIFLVSSLDNINDIIKNTIHDSEKEESYFIQYVHTIIYIFESMDKNKQVKWIKSDETDDIIIKSKENNITEIITPVTIETNKLPSKLISRMKKLYEKTPILHK